MKTIIITIFLSCGALLAAAQQKTVADTSAKINQTAKDQKVTYGESVVVTENSPIEAMITRLKNSTMPVAKLPNNDNGMPVMKTDPAKHNMPVIGQEGKPKAVEQKTTELLTFPKKP